MITFNLTQSTNIINTPSPVVTKDILDNSIQATISYFDKQHKKCLISERKWLTSQRVPRHPKKTINNDSKLLEQENKLSLLTISFWRTHKEDECQKNSWQQKLTLPNWNLKQTLPTRFQTSNLTTSKTWLLLK